MHKYAILKTKQPMLSQSQIKNIHQLDVDTCLEIMYECAERIGLVSVDDYEKIMSVPRRTIYSKMKSKSIKRFEISKHKFPLINE